MNELKSVQGNRGKERLNLGGRKTKCLGGSSLPGLGWLCPLDNPTPKKLLLGAAVSRASAEVRPSGKLCVCVMTYTST